ncbi:uncharacterized protein [Oryza sativa Japonica Group]|jgi:hypothetical protein|uniref:OSJNBa0020J04.5 protein n=4 Tax=Oryza TaxID=4527 RepID=A0A0P0WE60_ORYSJ|nr:uncharacterized protein LOC4336738 [Oryza sativa Japonica Group]KAB8096578.1 hypothetical protein EE612_025083 [Oryza sativa]EAZ31713.1 hypothetical protein OsJ_15863 [Oryza sativa Japonica Group]KAF2935463.1 hypothetical protein DAI22_04g233400 [Oryza sativa Japonica Group]KAF2935464.1 hypothetical protein DAI22_04g233400 [Oryza sativa Japonica Group]CAD41300.2 OSJNBa0020J04.5 [Oryza sativa Japonica Group]|eukprot:NP_001053625.1 Os04g0576500 [Oryza sativa Japonica Group]
MVSVYEEARERWTWKNQVTEEGPYGFKILSQIRRQDHDCCTFSAMASTLEANVRVQHGRNDQFSIPHLQFIDAQSKISAPNTNETKVLRLLKSLKERDGGVYLDEDYDSEGNLRALDAKVCRVWKFNLYHVKDIIHLRSALHRLRRQGPLLAVIRISRNYDECRKSGHVYKYDPARICTYDDGKPKTHALCVVSFVTEKGTPCLECQDSHGTAWGIGGYLTVEIRSLKELYSVRVT